MTKRIKYKEQAANAVSDAAANEGTMARIITAPLPPEMADTLRAGVQVLAETQADCMKALVGSRSLFRNANVLHLPSPPIEKTEETHPHDEDDEDDDEDDESPDWLEQLQPVVAVATRSPAGS